MVTLPISHLQIFSGDDPTSVTGQSAYYVYVNIYDVFGVDGVLSLENDDYSMKMGPEGESPWSASVDKVSKKSDYVEIKFIWSFTNKSLSKNITHSIFPHARRHISLLRDPLSLVSILFLY